MNYRALLILFISIHLIQCSEPSDNHEDKTLIDFFLPFETETPLVAEGIWGDQKLMPRDTSNGLEDSQLKNWCYWDGSIVKDDQGKFHMYASRWSQTFPHSSGWKKGSKGVHATSDKLSGPYIDQGVMWPQWKKGQGHNVIGLRMHDGRYAAVASEGVPGQVFVSDTPDGPWELLGAIQLDPNGYYPGWGRYNELDDGALRGGGVGNMANVMIILRPDNRYMIIARHCVPMISENGILGPYKMLGDKAWLDVKGIPQFKMEDPTVWYSDSLYHIVVNHYEGDTTFHMTSEDGIHNWKNRGLAFHRGYGVFRHQDGTREDWYTVQRPTVYMEDGVVKAFNFSVIDVHKGQDQPNDNHGSKIIVVPFDGESFGRNIRSIVKKENEIADATALPKPWQSQGIGPSAQKNNVGFDALVNTIRVKAQGNKLDGANDDFQFVYQKMTGDISLKVMVLSQDIADGNILSGIMFRKGLDTNSPFVLASISKEDGFSLSERSVQNKKATDIQHLDIEAPYWLRLEKRGDKVQCFVSSSNRMNWKKAGETTLALGDEFYAGLISSSAGDNQAGLARFKDVDVHTWGMPEKEGIIAHTFPDTIPQSGIVDFEIEYESRRTIDVWVELENVQTLKKHNVLRKRLRKNGIVKLTYNAGSGLDPDATYWFVIKAVPMHFHDSEHIQAGFKKVFVKK